MKLADLLPNSGTIFSPDTEVPLVPRSTGDVPGLRRKDLAAVAWPASGVPFAPAPARPVTAFVYDSTERP